MKIHVQLFIQIFFKCRHIAAWTIKFKQAAVYIFNDFRYKLTARIFEALKILNTRKVDFFQSYFQRSQQLLFINYCGSS